MVIISTASISVRFISEFFIKRKNELIIMQM